MKSIEAEAIQRSMLGGALICSPTHMTDLSRPCRNAARAMRRARMIQTGGLAGNLGRSYCGK